jgi:FkbM family methyltransferase
MPLLRRTLGAVSRRTGRPELLAAMYAGARQELYEQVAIKAILSSTLRSDATYVDVGSNRGQVLADALRVAPQGRHIAFEPIPGLAEALRREFPAVEVRAMALGSRQGRAQFCHFTSLDGWSGLRRSPQVSDEQGRPEYITVDVSTLDAEVAGLSPQVVKIDVEGAELEVIEGGRAMLSATKPIVIFEHVATAASLYGTSSEDVWDLLTELSYEIFDVTGNGPFTRGRFAENLTVVNWLARPRETAGER